MTDYRKWETFDEDRELEATDKKHELEELRQSKVKTVINQSKTLEDAAINAQRQAEALQSKV